MSKQNVSVAERAARYLQKMGPAISGAGGHTHTLLVARVLVKGFSMGQAEALGLMEEWNAGNAERWSQGELIHKLNSAIHGPGEDGYLLRDGERAVGGDRPARPVVVAPPVPTGPPPPPPIPLKFIGVLDLPAARGRVASFSDSRGNTFYGKEGDIIEGR